MNTNSLRSFRNLFLVPVALSAMLLFLMSGSAFAGLGGGTGGGTVYNGNLTLITNVINTGGGTAVAGDFVVAVRHLNGTEVFQYGSSYGTPSPGYTFPVAPGPYYVSNFYTPYEYNYTTGGDCAANGIVVIYSNITSTCVITDTFTPPTGTLTVTTNVNNNYGGTATSGSFNVNVEYPNGTQVTGSPASGSSSGTTYTLNPGTYYVSEGSLSGYTGSISGDCATNGSVTVSAGGAVSCTITNNDQPAHITVIEDVVGGTLAANAFTINVAGSSPSPSTFSGSATGTLVTINQGNYSVTENQIVLYNTGSGKGCGQGWWDNYNRWWWNGTKGNSQNDGWAANWTKYGWDNDKGGFDHSKQAGSWSGGKSDKQHIYGYYSVSYSTSCSGTIYVGQNVVCTITSNFVIPKRLSVNIDSNVSQVKLGGSFGLSADIDGGVAPYSYVMYVKNTTSRGQFIPTGQNGTATGDLKLTETPPKLGADFYEIVVTDALGQTASDTVHVVVNENKKGGGW